MNTPLLMSLQIDLFLAIHRRILLMPLKQRRRMARRMRHCRMQGRQLMRQAQGSHDRWWRAGQRRAQRPDAHP